MKPTNTETARKGQPADVQPARSDAPADADAQHDDITSPAAGSPAAPVMKQFQKTEAESSGKR